MSKDNPMHYAMKRAEYASKRQHFDPSEHENEKYNWFRIEVGDSFLIPLFAHKESTVRGMAYYRSNFSGYEFSIKKLSEATRVTRTA